MMNPMDSIENSSERPAMWSSGINPMDIIETYCQRPALWGSDLKTPNDLIAAIRGICVGLGDPRGDHCLGDFTRFVRSRFPEYGNESWYLALTRLGAGRSLREACDAILELVKEWHDGNPTIPAKILVKTSTPDEAIDTEKFQLLEEALRKPQYFVPGASTLHRCWRSFWVFVPVIVHHTEALKVPAILAPLSHGTFTKFRACGRKWCCFANLKIILIGMPVCW